MRDFLRAFLFVFVLAAAVPVVASASDAVPAGKLPASAIPKHYTLRFTVDPRTDRFSGETRIRVELKQPADRVYLHAEHLDFAKASITTADGKSSGAKPVAHTDTGVLELDFGKQVAAQTIELALDYTAPFNAQLEGLYKVKVGDDAYAITQMEPISARYAFPGFDEPRFKVPFDITLTVPADQVAVANTLQTNATKSADGKWKTLTFATTKPLPTYLVAFAVGPWDVVDAPAIPASSVRKNPIPLRGIAPRGKGGKLAWVLGETPAVVRFYEEYTNQPYPFDKLDLLGAPDFSAGAMENAGLIVYRDALLLIDESSPSERYRSVFNVNAHEIAHQWYGDLVTVPWWDDIWLNEAYATWAQRKATLALKPEYFADTESLERRLGAMENDSLLTARKVRQPINGHGDIETAFDSITYQKGASVPRDVRNLGRRRHVPQRNARVSREPPVRQRQFRRSHHVADQSERQGRRVREVDAQLPRSAGHSARARGPDLPRRQGIARSQAIALSALRRARRRRAALGRAGLHAIRTRRRQEHAVLPARKERAALRCRGRLPGLVSAERGRARLLPLRDDTGRPCEARQRDGASERARASRLRRRAVERFRARRDRTRRCARRDAVARVVGHAASRDRATAFVPVDPRAAHG